MAASKQVLGWIGSRVAGSKSSRQACANRSASLAKCAVKGKCKSTEQVVGGAVVHTGSVRGGMLHERYK